jgi:hypothetical protein
MKYVSKKKPERFIQLAIRVFDVDYDLYNSGNWAYLPDGGKLWLLGIECPSALSINLIFDQYRLPTGATLYIFGEDKHDKIGGFTDHNNQADGFFATDIVLNDKIIIEYYQPPNASFDGELRLATVVHGYRGSFDFQKGFGQSGACQRNAICPEGAGWEDQIRSVFALYSGGIELCSGAILNNTANDLTPYALTANHCYSARPNPGIWVFRFNWESPTCTPTTNSTYQTMTGSQLRVRTATNTSAAGTDACLVELNQPIPMEYGVYYAGWSRSTTAPTSGMIIHHPRLDIKKITPSTDLLSVVQYVQGWRANFVVGGPCTEGGSSGSPLFDQNHRVIGQEYGGESACGASAANMFDVWGKFDVSWTATNIGGSTLLKDYLDPLNINPETLDGTYTGEPLMDAELLEIVAPDEIYYYPETIEPVITVKNRGNIPITSATVSYSMDSGSTISKQWTGTLGGGNTVDVTFDPIILTLGTHTFKATVNVEDDDNPDNDSKTKNFEVKDCLLEGVFLQEDFENEGNLPDCWQNIIGTGTELWIFVTGNNGQGNPPKPQSGTFNARFQSTIPNYTARLICPPMNIIDDAMPTPVLRFWHAQAKNSNKQDKLRVYYKNSPSAEWKQLIEYSTDITTWKKEYIVLLEPTEHYWVAFEGVSAGGSGVILDNIAIVQTCLPVQNIAYEVLEAEILVNWQAPEDTDNLTGYAFYVNETLIATDIVDTTFIFPFTEEINYDICIVALYDYDWCQESEKECVLAPLSVGKPITHLVNIYPNPTNSHIFVEGNDIKSVGIYTLQGQLLYLQNNNTSKIDVSSYAAGNYLIMVSFENGQNITKQISIKPF